ncbi:MAG: hypothetical protein KGJ13_11580 [Patescibacteria group bacterium]|nr:hypothetical protein [Patescibacteria group bacterium]
MATKNVMQQMESAQRIQDTLRRLDIAALTAPHSTGLPAETNRCHGTE